jgi:hypothetical protein
VSARPMSVYVDKTWVRQEGRYWIAKAIAFSESDNDVTISACHEYPHKEQGGGSNNGAKAFCSPGCDDDGDSRGAQRGGSGER